MSATCYLPDSADAKGVPASFAAPSPRAVRLALLVVTVVSIYAVLVHTAALPSHQEGHLQEITAPLTAIDSLVQLPGRVVVRVVRLGVLHVTRYWIPLGWHLGVLANAMIYFGLTLFAVRIYTRLAHGPAAEPAARIHESADEPNDAEPLRPLTRRRFLAGATQTLGAGMVAGVGYGVVIEPRSLEITRHRIGIRDLPYSLDGLRVVQLTDLHHGPWLSREFLRAVIDAGNRLEPDLFLLTGDFIHQAPEFIGPVAEELTRLRPRIGTVAVLGNHDWWEDVKQVRAAFAGVEIPLIDNDRRVVTPDGRLVTAADDGLALAGVGDLWEDRPNYVAALKGLPESMPRLLLSHNPDVAEEHRFVRSSFRVDLMVSGHTHGGQVRIPFMGAPVVPSRFGQKYAEGLVQGPTCPVFISRGIGLSGLPIRVNARPEVALLELNRADAKRG